MTYVTERFTLAPALIDEIQEQQPEFGYDGYGEIIFYDKYSRVKDEETGEMESWNDCVIRVIEGILSIRKDHYLKNGIKWSDDFWNVYSRGMALSLFDMKWLPPGRGLWAMGTDFIYERGSMALNNCGFKIIDDDIGAAMSWIMDALMCGVGVGFYPERNDDLKVYEPNPNWDECYVISDDREGWYKSIESLINSYLIQGSKTLVFNYDKIRKHGEPIRGFGGTASGPGPLKELHERIRTFFRMYKNKQWYDSVLLKADIANCVGCCVIAGNVRRSAELACAPIHDKTFLNLKNYDRFEYRQQHGWMSNNSVFLFDDEDFEDLDIVADANLKNHDLGYINLRNISKGRIGRDDGLRYDNACGFNPCQPAWAKVLTPEGIREFKDIEEGSRIWSESGWTTVIKKWSTGNNKVWKYTTTAGIFYGTKQHKVCCDGTKVPVENAYAIDMCHKNYEEPFERHPQAIMDGLLIGDGTVHCGHVLLDIGEKDQDYWQSEVRHLIKESYNKERQFKVVSDFTANDIPYTSERTVPDRYFYATSDVVCNFLRGLFSANGCVTGNRIQLRATSFLVIERVQTMLSSIGIQSYWSKDKSKWVEFPNGYYQCRDSYNLQISTDRQKFKELIGFIQEYKQLALLKLLLRIESKRGKKTFEIISEELVSTEETFDITVNNPTHTYWSQGCNVSNCGEQPLEDGELCCLAETLPTRCKDSKEWLKACEYATVYASTVTLLPTHRPETNSIMLRNRRIGVGIVDVSGWKHTCGTRKVIKNLRAGYQKVRQINQWVNSEAGVPEAIRVTTIKPGGTTPKLAGRTAGRGNPTFTYTLRRTRIAKNSSMYHVLDAAGIPHEPDIYDSSAEVFEYPILQGPAVPISEVSLWEQAMDVVMLQREWSDNAVSNTLYFKDEEENQIEPVLSIIAAGTKSVSLARHAKDGMYPQTPETGISKEEYEQRLAQIKKINWSELRHNITQPEKYCTGESCELNHEVKSGIIL